MTSEAVEFVKRMQKSAEDGELYGFADDCRRLLVMLAGSSDTPTDNFGAGVKEAVAAGDYGAAYGLQIDHEMMRALPEGLERWCENRNVDGSCVLACTPGKERCTRPEATQPKPQSSYEPLTEAEIEAWRSKIKGKIFSDFCGEPNEAHGRKLQAEFDRLCNMAVNCILYGEEICRLRNAPLSAIGDIDGKVMERVNNLCERTNPRLLVSVLKGELWAAWSGLNSPFSSVTPRVPTLDQVRDLWKEEYRRVVSDPNIAVSNYAFVCHRVIERVLAGSASTTITTEKP